MLSYQEALKIILDQADVFGTRIIPLNQARGRVAAEEIHGQEKLPPFNNSAMDGFAVKSDQLKGVDENNPLQMAVEGSTMAGDYPAFSRPSDICADTVEIGAWEIMTGAPVPVLYDCVIRVEDVTILEKNDQGRPTRISLHAGGFPGKNIRTAGSDFNMGDRLIDRGQVITSHHIMALSALGHDRISVVKRPTVAVLSTGKELVDEMDQALQPGQIRNCNGPYLMECLESLNIPSTNEGTIFDDPEKFEQKLADILAKDTSIILSSGAVSMGRHDFVPDGLRNMGAEILLHKTAIRPGKPILFARFPNGTYYFGLPGNPVATVVGLRFFAYPLIRALQGLTLEQPVSAVLQDDFVKESPFRFFLKSRYDVGQDGLLKVQILPGQESFRVKPMLDQNCWAVVLENVRHIEAGQKIDIFPLFPPDHGNGRGPL